MARTNDVELIIRAKDEATRAIDSVVSALKEIKGATSDLTGTTGKADNAMIELGQSISQLQGVLKGLSAFGTVAAQVERAEKSITRLQTSAAEAERELADLQAKQVAAAQSAAQAAAKYEQAERSLRAYSQAAKQNEQATKGMASAQARLDKLATPSPVSFNANKSARDSYNVFFKVAPIENDIAKYREELQRTAQVMAQNQNAANLTKKEVKALELAANSAASVERKLASEIKSTSAALDQRRDSLERATTELGQLRNIAAQGSSALGGVAAKQDEITAAAKKAEAGLQSLTDAQKRLAAAQKDTGAAPVTRTASELAAAIRTQQQAVSSARESYLALRQAATQLGAEIARVKQPSSDLATQFLVAKTNAAAAEQQFLNAATALSRLRSSAREAFGSLQSATQQLSQTAASTASAANSSRTFGSATGQLGAAYKSATSGARGFNGELKNGIELKRTALSFTQRLRGQLLSITAAYIGFFQAFNQVNQVIVAYRTLEAAQNRLGAALGGDTLQVRRELEFLTDTANRLGLNFGILADEYGKFLIAAKASNFTNEGTRKIFTAVAEAARVNKLSQEQLTGTLLALQQMISKGTVSSEELRRQLGDRLPGAFNLFADAIGVSTAQLDKMLRAGEVLATEETLLKFAERLTAQFGPQLGKSLQTLSTQLDQFTNRVFQLRNEVGRGGFVDALAEGLKEFNQQLASPEAVRFARSVGAALGELTRIAFSLVDALDEIALAFQAFLAIKIGTYFAQAGGAMAGFAAQLAATRAAILATATSTSALATGFNAAATGSSVAFTTMRAQAAGLAAALLQVRVQSNAAGAALVVLRAGVLTLATAFRALWAAVGGWVGVLATLVSFGLIEFFTRWVSTVDTATDALNRQEDAVFRVRDAYKAAEEGAKDWQDRLKGLTRTEIQINTNRLKSQLQEIREGVTGSRGFFGAVDLTDPISAQINRLRDAFQSGTLSGKALLLAIDALKQANPEIDDNLIAPMIKAANEAAKLEEQIDLGRAAMAVMAGTATDAQKALLGLATSAESLNSKFDPAQGLDDYNKALDELRDKLPKVNSELEEMDRILSQANLQARTPEQIASFMETFNQVRDNAMLKVAGAEGLSTAVDLLKRFEGFRSSAYWDVNAFRAGFGSDTVTLADGSIQKIVEGMSVSRDDAFRDLVRRTQEFQQVVIGQIGGERFNALSTDGQAALVSIAYNYGSLPDRILEAIRTGTAAEMASAVRGLATDNNGINASRRNAEADLLAKGSPQLAAQIAKDLQAAADAQQSINRTLDESVASRQIELQQAQLASRELAVQKAQQDVLNRLNLDRNQLTEEQRAKLEEIGRLAGEQFDRSNRQADAEAKINNLVSQREELLKMAEFYRNAGDDTAASQVEARVSAINDQLRAAIPDAIAFWQSIGGPEADLAIARLQNLGLSLDNVGQKVLITREKIVDMLTDGASNAFDQLAQAIANGQNVIRSLGDAFRAFAADFLRQLAQMIIKQQIFNALQAAAGKGGFLSTVIGAAIGGTTGAPVAHTGGIIGSTPLPTRNVSPALFRNALRYHDGGIAGLKPGEVPAILQKGEEVLTADDPRHVVNGGGGSANVKIVNAIDAGDFVSQGMSTKVGEQAILNFIRANSRAVRSAMGSA